MILLHGVGGNESNLLDLAECMYPQTLVVFPRRPLPLGAQQFSWFRMTCTAAGPSIVAEEAERSRLALILFVQQVQARDGIPPMTTVIAGFSQGGILSASVALSAPEQVRGFGLLSGRILPELKPHMADPMQLAYLNAFIEHGQSDTTLPVSWARRCDQWLSELGVAHQPMWRPPNEWGAGMTATPTGTRTMLHIGSDVTRVTRTGGQPDDTLVLRTGYRKRTTDFSNTYPRRRLNWKMPSCRWRTR